MKDLNEDKKDVCPFCGKEWVEGDRYCRYCGSEKDYPEPEEPTAELYGPEEPIEALYGPAWVFDERNR